jgi:hypothetical protein
LNKCEEELGHEYTYRHDILIIHAHCGANFAFDSYGV